MPRPIPVLASLLVGLAVICAAWPLGAAQSRPQDVALQAAIRTETIDGNPTAAAEQFKTIIKTYPNDRAVVARALVHLADCYRKMGDAAARDVYARVVKEYPEQRDAVELAQAGLSASEGDVAPVRRIWTLPRDTNAAGRVSWNGRWLAYVNWTDTGAGDLFLRDFVSGSDRRLTRTGNKPGISWKVFADGAVISRDGSQIAYEWWDNGRAELRILRLQGAPVPPRVLERDPSILHVDPRDWTQDGRWIAALWRKKDQTLELGLISTADGSVRPLKTLDRACACVGNVALALSPDGRYLAYHMPGTDTLTRDIYVLPTAGGAVIPAVVYRGDDALVGWAPDGRSIVFKSDRAGSAGLWYVPFENSRAGSADELKLDIGAFEPLGITAAGAIFGCRCEPQLGSDIKIASIDLSTGQFLSPPVDAVQEYIGTNTQPFWSNDGRYFLHRSLRPNQDPMLVIRSADTMALVRELRPKLATIDDPRWSPDDKSIAVIGRDFENKFGYYRIDVETGKAAPIILYPSPGNRMGPMGPESSWSDNGRKLYFRRYAYTPPRGADIESFLVEVDVASGAERILVRLPAPDPIPAALLSDKGTMFYRRPAGTGGNTFAIVALDLISGAERELIRRPSIGNVNLSPDGRWLGLTIEPTAGTLATILLVPTSGGEPIELWRAEGSQPIGAPRLLPQGAGAWAPDSRSLISRRIVGTNQPEFWWLPIDGLAPRKLDEFGGLVPAGLRIHPDGKRLLFGATVAGASSQESKPTEIWVWENLLGPGGRR
jgi:Tol biopolymer transport system component